MKKKKLPNKLKEKQKRGLTLDCYGVGASANLGKISVAHIIGKPKVEFDGHW